mmetsp:Transcript_14965/g.10460  ORF Transcript_14965/g.10460 Transcript_14965/m.10460 type:complete len:88 (-) Transcript_14965:1007-1270(-)
MRKDDLQRFYYEIHLLKSLDHPNICKIFEYFETSEKLYLVIELCTGEELYEKINKRKKIGFSEREIASCVQQLLHALNYCHKNGIIH